MRRWVLMGRPGKYRRLGTVVQRRLRAEREARERLAHEREIAALARMSDTEARRWVQAHAKDQP